jgi:putative SOS response-associated peptidase YedK
MAQADGKLDSEEKLYTYTIITTGSNKQLEFLHDRYVHGSDLRG